VRQFKVVTSEAPTVRNYCYNEHRQIALPVMSNRVSVISCPHFSLICRTLYLFLHVMPLCARANHGGVCLARMLLSPGGRSMRPMENYGKFC